ncbi:MAG: DUF1446 domain-containing protein [Planctomycetota bacterium]|nr:DUF1446 domain-containing protein [Planctomycetota bacterium]
MKTVRIGSGAGYAGDRLPPAVELMEKGNLDYIIFECLAERTIAIAQDDKRKDPTKGYNPLLEFRMKKVIPLCKKKGVKVITNMGAANPASAVEKIALMATEMGISGLKIAAVTGDDVFGSIDKFGDYDVLELGCKLSTIRERAVSANAYLGSEGIVEALRAGADIVVTGRCSDPALVVAPLMHEFGWKADDWDRMGKGIMVGHLLECAAQSSGGYYPDPGYKDVPELWKVGFPIAEVSENGDTVITKVEGSGGAVNVQTCKEQLVYEIHDPKCYKNPDGVADFSNVTTTEIGKDRVAMTGATGSQRPDTLKVMVGYSDCFVGEGQISYGGTNCLARAKLAGETVAKRLEQDGAEIDELRIDYIGYNSLYGDHISSHICPDDSVLPEVRLRVAARTKDRANAQLVAWETEALYVTGPSGGAGADMSVKEVVSMASIFIPREFIKIHVIYKEV